MLINYNNVVSFFPSLNIILTIFILLLLIIFYKRNNFIITLFGTIGLLLSIILIFIFYNEEKILNLINILFLIDNTSKVFNFFIIFTSLISVFFSFLELKKFQGNKEEFYILILIITLGCLVSINSNHMASLFIGIEMMSLPVCGLIFYDTFSIKEKYISSLNAATKYYILSSLSSIFLFFGISILYFNLGCLNFIDIAKAIYQIPDIHKNKFFLLGILMIFSGFAIKLSFVPFHLWAPEVYKDTKYSILLLLASSIKITTFIILIKIFTLLLPVLYQVFVFKIVFFIFLLLSIIIGNIIAISQKNIKLLISYSSIAQFGYFITVFLVLIETKNLNYNFFIETIKVYFFSYILNIICFFSILNYIEYKLTNNFLKKTSRIDYHNNFFNLSKGLFWQYPTLSICLIISILSFLGIPMTLGFISKFYLFLLNIKNQLPYFLLIIMIGMIISCIYYLKLITNLFLIPKKFIFYHHKQRYDNKKINFHQLIILVSSFFILLLGIFPQILIHYIK